MRSLFSLRRDGDAIVLEDSVGRRMPLRSLDLHYDELGGCFCVLEIANIDLDIPLRSNDEIDLGDSDVES